MHYILLCIMYIILIILHYIYISLIIPLAIQSPCDKGGEKRWNHTGS